jgi:hypothetical protein
MIKITLTFISNKHLFTIYEAIMEILDEFDIKIIKELEKDGQMAYSAIATNLKYRIPWCINASIDRTRYYSWHQTNYK